MTKNQRRVLGGKIGELRKELRKTRGGFIFCSVFLAVLLTSAWSFNTWTSFSLIAPGVLMFLGMLMEAITFFRIRKELGELNRERDQLQNNTSELTSEGRGDASPGGSSP